MSDDWDADDFEPAAPVVPKASDKGQWDDEDKEEDSVKESWEDEDKPAPPKPKPEKKKKKDSEDKGKAKEIDTPLDDPIAEKLRQQRLVEEADLKTAKELFGGKEGKSLDDFIPKTEADFVEYAELLASKVTPFSKSFHYHTLLKHFLRKATATLTAADAKDINAAMAVIANEKLKAEKEATAGKKKGGAKKKELKVDREVDDFTNKYDDSAQDDYDFM